MVQYYNTWAQSKILVQIYYGTILSMQNTTMQNTTVQYYGTILWYNTMVQYYNSWGTAIVKSLFQFTMVLYYRNKFDGTIHWVRIV